MAAQATAAEPVFAGVAYLANASDAPKLFPFSWAIDSLAKRNGTTLDDRFFRALEKSGVHLSRELAARQGVAFALAFDEETASRDRIANRSRLLVTIGAQLVAFDFKEQLALASFPVSVERIEIVPDQAGAAFFTAVRDTLFRLVTSDDRSLLKLAADSYRRLKVRDGLPCKIQTQGATLDSSAARVGNGRFPGNATEVSRQLSDIFARTWITVTNYPLLPSQQSQAVNGKMAGQFSDGRIFNLKVPDPDYLIVLDSAATRRKTVGSSAAGRTDAVGAYMQFTVLEPLTKTRVASGTFKDVIVDQVPALQTEIDEWIPARGAFESLFAGFSSAVRTGDTKWFTEHAVSPSAAQAGPQFHTWLTSKCALSH
jgi:hypothetical protein